ncbi:nucleoid-associated protein [Dysgonomonas sp. GY75]|uniref:nucleoid-associated protein n=1 Tax=Dysgonomonas sp. GY75 TaxID=2780419 RepID=UPI00188470A7|nr:nucleoid-associated protein [Dysgonomonas sp. GY75]MBF0648837.1 nucleoid-associated protein [Dysgonomonas sp. GY75]
MAKTLKEIGHNIELRGFVIHQVIKDAGDRHTVLKEAKSLIPTTNKERQFVGRINKAYNQKSGPTYGIFGDEDTTFKELLKKYRSDNDFLSFSEIASRHYKSKIASSAPATGGFIIFSHYLNTDTNHEFIFVLTINNKDGYVVSESDLTIKDIKNLDLSKVDVACLINITKWEAIESGANKDGKTYLSFIKGNKGVTFYFMSFIDCADKTTSTESTKRLIYAIDSFCKEKEYERKDIIKKKDEIFSYCSDCIKNKKEISLITISALINANEPSEFAEFASDEKYEVSPIISGDPAKLKNIKYVHYKDDNITIAFDNMLLGKNIIYDPQKKHLTFKDLPSGLINELER